MKKAIFPGSFNPLHNGHIKIIDKALKLFDQIVLAITINPEKQQQDNFNERFAIANQKLAKYKNVEIIINDNRNTAELAKEMGINFLIRSGRGNTDYKYEIELAAGNKALNHKLETIMFFPGLDDINYSSRLEKQRIK